MPMPTPGLVLDYLPLTPDSARIVRVYGETPCVSLPEALPAPDGKALAVRELGGYCFAEAPRALPPRSALCRARVETDGRVTLCGESPADAQSPAQPDADGEAPAEIASSDAAFFAPTPICGALLEELTLPDALRTVGSCAFYNCRRLRRLSLGGGISTYGSDVFLNDFALCEAVLRAAPGEATCLFKLVNNLQSALRVVFWPVGEAAPCAALWYPEYWEDIEETPAHILLHAFSGQGYHYRQCFLNGTVLWAEYDAVFPQSRAEDPPAAMALLCLDRLRLPYSLSAEAAEAYRAFLAQHHLPCVQRLLKAQDTEALAALLALELLDKDALAEAAALAADAGCAEAAALIADAEQRYAAAHAPKKKTYSFDDF